MIDEYGILDSAALIQARLFNSLKSPVRPWATERKIANRGVMINGPRGIGKTSFLLRSAERSGARYLSMDHPALSPQSLFMWVERLFQRGITAVYLDEIHAARDWSRDLKALYDSWPACTIWASGSSSLLLSQGIADLSRRFVSISMPPLSFREYLVLRGREDFGVQDPLHHDETVVAGIVRSCPVLSLFEEYLQYGFRPLFTEGVESYPQKLLQVVQKTMEADIPFLVPNITQNHFRLMNAVLGYLSQSNIPVIQVNSLCREWNLGKEKLYSLLHAMEQTGLLRIIRYATDHSAMSVGAKIFFADPSLYPALAGKEGNMREAFVAAALEYAGHSVHSSRDETAADFIVDKDITIEVGGLRKKRKSARYVVRDGADFPAAGMIPMWLLGFGW